MTHSSSPEEFVPITLDCEPTAGIIDASSSGRLDNHDVALGAAGRGIAGLLLSGIHGLRRGGPHSHLDATMLMQHMMLHEARQQIVGRIARPPSHGRGGRAGDI